MNHDPGREIARMTRIFETEALGEARWAAAAAGADEAACRALAATALERAAQNMRDKS